MDEINRAKLAFLYHHAELLVTADRRLYREEVAALTALNGELIAAGLMSEDGTLQAEYTAAVRGAVTLLAGLPAEERAALIERLRPIASVDGEVDPSEERALAQAAAALGL